MPLQRDSFSSLAAQMRGAIENVGDEGGTAERKGMNAVMSSTKPNLATKRADEILDFFARHARAAASPPTPGAARRRRWCGAQ